MSSPLDTARRLPSIDLSEWDRRGRPLVIVSLSGGKDSLATWLTLLALKVPCEAVYQDTGWEWSGHYDYLDYLEKVVGPIRRLGLEGGMVGLCRKKGMFPSREFRFCTQYLKVYVMGRYLDTIEEPIVNAVGIRNEESASRANMTEWERAEWKIPRLGTVEVEQWRPIIRWTEQEVIDTIKAHGIRTHPLYLAGATRVGCWPCIMSRKAEIRMVAELDPGRIALIEALEAEVSEAARLRREAKGEPMDGWTPPALFRQKTDTRRTINGVREKATGLFPCWPIRRVVEWAKGPAQVELFDADPWMRGCARWGMCDWGKHESL